ncbi:MAG TPA: cytochrome c [Candidatus Kapabacteria bacterium]|nr:cytochrome c [Candidatus Kapabacteria bacterium]
MKSYKMGMRAFFILISSFFILNLTACRQDMQDQPKYLAYRGSEIFPDSLSSRPLVEGTIPRGYLREDQEYYTGKTGASVMPTSTAESATKASASTTVPATPASAMGNDVNEFPFPITPAILDRGQERFNIYCSPCHGVLGDGRGMVVNRGFSPPPSYHIDRLRTAPLGHFFDVITNGFGRMPDYAMQVPPHERWAIIAYIRALQLSQNAPIAVVPQSDRSQLQ